MAEKSIQISVRVGQDDASFLSALKIEGATTPSEKMRALLRQARKQHEGYNDYPTELEFMSGLHRGSETWRLSAERELGLRSDVMRVVTDWIVECEAYLLSAGAPETDAGPGTAPKAPPDPEAVRAALVDLEAGAADRVFQLIDQILRLGVTETCPAYDPEVVRRKLQSLVELMTVIMSIQDGSRKER